LPPITFQLESYLLDKPWGESCGLPKSRPSAWNATRESIAKAKAAGKYRESDAAQVKQRHAIAQLGRDTSQRLR